MNLKTKISTVVALYLLMTGFNFFTFVWCMFHKNTFGAVLNLFWALYMGFIAYKKHKFDNRKTISTL